ncbi:sister chromatid cohesion protein DCC1 [Microplitis mediator]|uniref:sister chromatid cohesion protein DCC1 n=1 Tax=Microplitis mediator TaxID=375433 RepID=UPI002557645C|nr:sister chromatid cohesion protein DCC1 [Microplitis mediator]
MEDSASYVRDEDDICATLNLAKLNESQVKKIGQVLDYRHGFSTKDIKLLELDNHMLETLERGKSLFFKGQKDDVALLCTDSRTYKIEEAETSNSLLLCSNLKFAKDIPKSDGGKIEIEHVAGRGIFHNYFEVSTCKPELGKLLTLLEPSSFKGPEYEKYIDKDNLYDWDKLINSIQASEKELEDALIQYSIASLDGYYRLISFEFETKALTMMLDFMEENSWKINKINKEETYEALKDLIPKPIFEIIFNKYANKNSNECDKLYTYDEKKVCRCLAQVLLASSPVNDYNRFMEAWKMGVPEEINPKLEYLYGTAVVVWNADKQRKDIVSFPESKLSDNIVERFNQLFKVKNRWTAEEIKPYISNLSTSNLSVDFLLTKHTRSLTVNGIKYYSSKYK